MRRSGRLSFGLLSIGLAAVLLLVVMPHALGIGWDATEDQVEVVPRWDLAALIGVWAAGLWLHTIVLRRSLPGLSRTRAFALNLGGSGVANVLPLGGAAGIGLNYAMLRSWGYNRLQITAFTTISNLVVALVKVAIAVAGLVAFLFMPNMAAQLTRPTSTAAIAIYATVATVGLGGVLAYRHWHRGRDHGLLARLSELRQQCAHHLRRGWRGLAIGGLGYPALQMVLLWSCLAVLQVHVPVQAVFAAYAVERMLTLVPLTPGGLGLVETAATATLVGFGAPPVSAAAGVVLFRVFSYLIEIPLGALVAAAWFARSRSSRGQVARA